MADKEFDEVTDSGELSGNETALIFEGTNSRESTYDLMARFLRGSQVNDQSGTSYTAVLADAGKTVRMSNAAANTFTIPPNSSVAYKIGARIWVTQIGVGTTTIVEGSGVTINKATNLILGTQWQPVSLLKVAVNTWDLTKGVEYSLNEISDVDLITTTPRKNDRLMWNGTSFVPVGSSICRLSLKVETYAHAVGKISTWTEVEDTDNYFGGGEVPDEHVEIPFTGRYRMTWLIGLASKTNTSQGYVIYMRKNRGATTTQNNDIPHAALVRFNEANSVDLEVFVSVADFIVDLLDTDEIDIFLRIWHNVGNRDTLAGFWNIEYIGETP